MTRQSGFSRRAVSTGQFSNHATQRTHSRSISEEAVTFTMTHGKRVRQRGAIFFYLGKRHIPHEMKKDSTIRRWEGTTVVMSPDERAILTVYRNRSGIA